MIFRLFSKTNKTNKKAPSKTGEENPWIELYHSYSPVLFSHISSIVPDKTKATKVLQTVFTWACTNPDALKNTSRLFISLLNKARNEAIDELIKSQELVPNGTKEVQVNSRSFYSFIAGLPPLQKTITALVFYRGISIKEASTLLQLPVHFVETKMQDTLQGLPAHVTPPTFRN